jgi:hypothetical protein
VRNIAQAGDRYNIAQSEASNDMISIIFLELTLFLAEFVVSCMINRAREQSGRRRSGTEIGQLLVWLSSVHPSASIDIYIYTQTRCSHEGQTWLLQRVED